MQDNKDTSGFGADVDSDFRQDQPTEGFAPAETHISWTASEYLAHQKGASWYGVLALAVILLVAIVFIVTRDIISSVVIGLVGVLFGVFAARQPRVLNYSIDEKGVRIGEKLYPFASFKSFSVGDDQAISYISLLPLRRFMPPLTIHYAPEDEEAITETLALYLPFEEHKKDLVDSLSHRIRF